MATMQWEMTPTMAENKDNGPGAFSNPEWEKAQLALKKLQEEKSPVKEEKKENHFNQSFETQFYQPSMYSPIMGRFPPPPPGFGFGFPPPPGPYPPRSGGFGPPYGLPHLPRQPMHHRPPFQKFDKNAGEENGESHEGGDMHYGFARNSNQAPGAQPIRFNLPKKNQVRAQNPMQNFSPHGQPKFRPAVQGMRHPGPQQPSFPHKQQAQLQHGAKSAMQAEEQSKLVTGMKQETPPEVPFAAKMPSTGTAAAAKDWSPSLKEYVQRCFASVQQKDMDKMEGLLREKITAAFHNGIANTIEWEKEAPVYIPNAGPPAALLPNPQNGGVKRWGGDQNSKVFSFGQGQQQHAPANRGHDRGRRGGSRGRAWSPPGIRRQRSRSRSRTSSSRSRSRSKSPPRHNTRHGGARKRRNSRSSSPDSMFSSDESDSGRSHTKSKRGNKVEGRGEGKSRRGRGGRNTGDKTPQQQNKKNNKKNKKKKSILGMDERPSPVKTVRMQQREQRFGNVTKQTKRQEPLSLQINQTLETNDDGLDWSAMHIIGTCTSLVKDFFRLTTAPDPSTVRPQHILKKSLEMVKKTWKADQNYRRAWEQIKSIRQDLTVQNVRTDFVVEVYETHARIALEKGDHEEFNQCQTQLIGLYLEGHKGSCNEFTAYRILYYIYTSSTSDLVTLKASLSQEMRGDAVIKHALDIQAAFAVKNFHRFFKLYEKTPKMSGYLIDWFIERVRKEALKIIVKSYVFLSTCHNLGGGNSISFFLLYYRYILLSLVSIMKNLILVCTLYLFFHQGMVSFKDIKVFAKT